jgi:hypothetical protein
MNRFFAAIIFLCQAYTLEGQSTTFSYTGAAQTYTVPACVFSITVDARGAAGGSTGTSTGGAGGRVQAVLAVTPGEILNIYVGGAGVGTSAAPGGWNGGGATGTGTGGSGGGASDIRRYGNNLSDRILVAGGGGGTGTAQATNNHGGGGGGLTGMNGLAGGVYGTSSCGAGGSQVAGGQNSTTSGSSPGALGLGGMGGAHGGGGGGGYYGGGGGAGAIVCCTGGGGGGGSSYVEPTATGVTHTQAFQAGNGQITITPSAASGPAQPGTVTGPASVCAGNTLTYSISPVPNATGYTWAVPSGAVIVSGQNTTSVTVTFGTTPGNISVTASNSCGTSPTQILAVTISPPPQAPVVGSNSPVCEGTTLNLTANMITGATYNWSGPNLFSSPIQNPSLVNVTSSASGTYTLTIDINGCTSPPSTLTVTVNPQPAVPSITVNSPVCEGTAINFTSSSVPGASYLWSGANAFASTQQNPSITNATASAAGTYSLIVTVNNCQSQPATTTVVVNTPQAPVVTVNGSTVFCDGDSVQLTSSSSMNYLWSNWETTQSVWITESGIYYVGITDSNGCPTVSQSTQVTVNPLPAVSFTGLNGGYCIANGSAVLNGNPAGGTFSGPGITGNSFSPQAAGIGMHTIIYSFTDTNGCSATSSANTVISSNAYVNLGADTIICTTATLILDAGSFSGYTWQDSSTAQTFTVDGSALIPGTYTFYVNVADANGCTGTDSIVVNVSVCTGMDDGVTIPLSVSPNPTSGILHVSVGDRAVKDIELYVFDLAGQMLFEKHIINSGPWSGEIDLSMLAKGVYYMQVREGNNSRTCKIIVQ